MKKFSLSTLIVLVLFAVLLTFQITYLSLSNKYQAKFNELTGNLEVYDKLGYIDELYRANYVGEIDEEKLLDGLIIGYLYGTGDKYANYMDTEEFTEYMKDAAADLEGIGVFVIYNADYGLIEIASVMPDSPALECGVMPGDLITEINGSNAAELGYYNALAAMKGKAGTTVNFTVQRGEYYENEVKFTVERRHVEQISVMSHMHEESDIGIVKILGFDEKTPEEFVKAVTELRSAGAAKLVFDVRYNPGGQLESIISVLDYLLPEGPIIRLAEGNGTETRVYNSDAKELMLPMAVVINGQTASAAELFTAALKDYKKAIIVGETTYGKGTMQSIIPLPDNSAVSISTQMYNPPYSENYEGVGVTPDIEVKMTEEAEKINIYRITDAEDTQLMAAINELNK